MASICYIIVTKNVYNTESSKNESEKKTVKIALCEDWVKKLADIQ